MDDDILIDVFRPLPRKQLSQSVALVCRRFRYLVNSPALPNLHCIRRYTSINYMWPNNELYEWGFDMLGSPKDEFVNYEQLQTTHRPTQYLRFPQLAIWPEHLAKEHWRKCLWEFRHCFADCTLMLSMGAQFTAVEFQCFLADWVLRLFPNCIYFITGCTFISSTDNKIEDLPTLEERANFNKSKFLHFRDSDRQTVASCLEPSLLISLPSIFNCPCVEIKARKLRGDRFCDPFIPQEDVIEWLHHVPAVPTTSARLPHMYEKYECKRYLLLSAAMLKPNEEDRNDNWYVQIVQVSHSVIKQIKKKFLLAKVSEEKREFYLELDVYRFSDIQRLEPFDIQNDATNERLTLRIHDGEYARCPYSYTYALLRKSV
ncbi:f-box-like domain-containing protein [Ditylenchus destructor]|uniref:F-box-like domain-containing protein n=1 Tax=Ditylenchus destructor TaxID=166010 RepID=A0AAD4QWL4_9BILA|nr:f-box-like domain-containing protein [Ditylenchus destructor]